MAAQSTLSEAYGQNKITASSEDAKLNALMDDVKKLAEVDTKKGWSIVITVGKEEGQVGQIQSVALWDGSQGCIYKDGKYSTEKADGAPTAKAAKDSISWVTTE